MEARGIRTASGGPVGRRRFRRLAPGAGLAGASAVFAGRGSRFHEANPAVRANRVTVVLAPYMTTGDSRLARLLDEYTAPFRNRNPSIDLRTEQDIDDPNASLESIVSVAGPDVSHDWYGWHPTVSSRPGSWPRWTTK